jgi:hypothetical protein
MEENIPPEFFNSTGAKKGNGEDEDDFEKNRYIFCLDLSVYPFKFEGWKCTCFQ